MTTTDAIPGSAPTPPRKSTTLRTVLLVVGSIILAIVLVTTVVRVANAVSREDTSGDTTITESFDRIDLRASAADVTVAYLDVSQPELRFNQGDTNLRLDHSVSNDELRVTVHHPGWGWWGGGFGDWGWWNHEGATLLIALPMALEGEGIDLSLDTTAGNLDVAGAFGNVTIESTAGDIELTGDAESVDITTTAGNLRLEGYSVTGAFRSESTAGDAIVELRELPDSMDMRSTAGDVRVELPRGDFRVETDTTAGDVRQNVSSDSGSDRVYRFETTAGDIELNER